MPRALREVSLPKANPANPASRAGSARAAARAGSAKAAGGVTGAITIGMAATRTSVTIRGAARVVAKAAKGGRAAVIAAISPRVAVRAGGKAADLSSRRPSR